MPFTSETAKLHRGRGGRKRKTHPDVVARKAALEIAREYLETHIDPVLETYGKLATGYTYQEYSDNGTEYDVVVPPDPATTRHFLDKVIPSEQIDAQRPLQINFVQFNNTLQLQAEGVSATVLAGNGKGHQAIGEGVASPERQGQDGLKFLDFEDVP